VLLLIPDPAKIVLAGGGFTTFPCGPLQPPRKVRVEYLPKPDPKKGTAGEAVFLEFP
jgi:hypothetical protein